MKQAHKYLKLGLIDYPCIFVGLIWLEKLSAIDGMKTKWLPTLSLMVGLLIQARKE